MRLWSITSLLVLSVTMLMAADPIAKFQAAMGTQDWAAKKKAISGLLSLPKEQDDQVLVMLIGAVDDRQASEPAIAALRSRTGLTPSPKRGTGGYPAYPAEDTAAAWNAWMAARKADLDSKKADKELRARIKDIEKEIAPETAAGTETSPVSENPNPVNMPAPEDLGGLDRIVFTNGSTLLGYVVSKRTDVDGKLVSVRVVHRDGAGEESITAELISRVDEDIQ